MRRAVSFLQVVSRCVSLDPTVPTTLCFTAILTLVCMDCRGGALVTAEEAAVTPEEAEGRMLTLITLSVRGKFYVSDLNCSTSILRKRDLHVY